MNLFENLCIMKENEDIKYWKFSGKVYLNNMKTKTCVGEIKKPIYVTAKSLGHAFSLFIDAIAQGNNKYEQRNKIFIDKNDIKQINELPDNADENITAIIESQGPKERYTYVGPVYRFGKYHETIKKPIVTIATSFDEAYRNICYQLKSLYKLEPNKNLSIDKDKIKKDDTIETSIKEFEQDIKEIEGPINDPKYNFEDPDREDEYIVESTMKYKDWFNKNKYDLLNKFINEYHLNAAFEDFADNEYDKYVRKNYSSMNENINRRIIESTMNYKDWFDLNFYNVLDKFMNTYKSKNKQIVNNEEFKEFIKNEYNNYVNNSQLKEDFDVTDTNQKYTSAKTSINSSKLPAIFKLVSFKAGTINLDFGGGKFDNAAEELAKQDVTNLVYDPYNRSSEHNQNVLKQIRDNGGADSVTCSNVLNVIAEPEARQTVIKNIYNLAKSGAPVYFTVYEGTGSGEGGETKSGYQLNKKTADYLKEIQTIFPNAKRKGKLIVANK